MLQKDKLNSLMQDLDALSSSKRAETIKQIGRITIPIEDLPLTLHSKLVMALEDPAPEVRAEAAMTIAFLEGEIAVPLLVPLLKDPVDTVRSSVISALSYTNVQLNEKLADKLMKNMEDKNPQIRDRCARALGRLKIKSAEKILLQCLGHDLSPIVRTGAAVGLGLFDNLKPDSLNTLRSLLKLETSSIVKNAIEETIACHFLPQND